MQDLKGCEAQEVSKEEATCSCRQAEVTQSHTEQRLKWGRANKGWAGVRRHREG